VKVGGHRAGGALASGTATITRSAVWQDVECGPYHADLGLWLELAAQAAPGAILDVGAGTGRVALPLARAGHPVTALDRDPELLAVLARRAGAQGLDIPTVAADATAFDLGDARFTLVAVPMQTIQLLPGAPGRRAFLARARRHLEPGGRVALAIADALEGFDATTAGLPPPDVGEHDGWRFVSQPLAVRELPDRARIERLREARGPAGQRETEEDVVELHRVSATQLEAEGAAEGLRAESARRVPATDDHVGSTVVVLRG
jgi:SAM-dependent methyltransferase